MDKFNAALTYKRLMKSTYEKIQSDLNEFRDRLYNFLSNSEVEVSKTDNLDVLISKLNQLKIMFSDKNYVTFKLDSNGYIVDKVPVNHFYEDNFNSDIIKGYYKLENNEVVLDYTKKRIMEEV